MGRTVSSSTTCSWQGIAHVGWRRLHQGNRGNDVFAVYSQFLISGGGRTLLWWTGNRQFAAGAQLRSE